MAQRSHLALATSFVLCFTVLVEPAYASAWQSLKSIESAAIEHASKVNKAAASRVESRVKALDRRLKLARCGTALEAFTPSSAGSGANRIIGVRCTQPKPWKVYVPISTAIYKEVVVANRPLTKGTPVALSDVRLEERDVTRIAGGYLTDLKQLEGRVLKRPIQDQAILKLNALSAEDIVQRGQNVTLMARNSKLNVRMRGEALGTAALNQRIKVKNLASKRIVEGVVVSRQVVLVDH